MGREQALRGWRSASPQWNRLVPDETDERFHRASIPQGKLEV